MERLRVLLISQAGPECEKYASLLAALPVDYDLVFPEVNIKEAISANPYNGILVDFKSLMKAPPAVKNFVNQLFVVYPVLSMRWDFATDRVVTLYQGSDPNGDTIEGFLFKICALFGPLPIRRQQRIKAYFNLLVSDNQSFPEGRTEKTVTKNVSEGGLYFFTIKDWKRHELIYLQVQEFDIREPIVAEVRWVVPWGTPMRFPGVGIEFKQIHAEQREVIRRLFK